jgi:hypothetical protein
LLKKCVKVPKLFEEKKKSKIVSKEEAELLWCL